MRSEAGGCCGPGSPGAPESPGGGAWSAARARPPPALPGWAEVPDSRVKKKRRERERSGRGAGARLEGSSGAGRGASLPGASLPPAPPSRCQVLRGGAGARGGDGWRLSSRGSRNANSARNGEATGGGGEALRLPQPPRCRGDLASRQGGLRARPPPRSPPGTTSAKTFGPGHKSLGGSAAPLGEGPKGSRQIAATPSSQGKGRAAAICQRG